MAADKFLVIGKNAIIGEEKFPEVGKGRQNVLFQGQRMRLHEWKGVHYVVVFYLDDAERDRVLGPHVPK